MIEEFPKQKFVLECLASYSKLNPTGEGMPASTIGEWIIDKYPDECTKKAENSEYVKPRRKEFYKEDGSLNKERYKWVLASEITSSYAPKDYKKESPRKWFREGIRFNNTKPRLFYLAKDISKFEEEWKTFTTSSAITKSIKSNESSAVVYDGNEVELYPKLGEFLYAEYGILSRRINHEKSKKGGQGDDKWLFPDVVGLEKLGESFDNDIRYLSDKKFKLWSFEVKKDLTRGQVREAYFQAVSNCSWANFGYLVTTQLIGEAQKEVEILANRYGIGVIQLNYLNPPESNVIIPARENDNIDWAIADKINKINDDFRKYTASIVFYTNNYDSKDRAIQKKDWDLTNFDSEGR